MTGMNRFGRILGIVFGYMTMALGLIVTGETAARKLIGWSMQGADELGGYILAVSSSLSFAVALIGRNHMRIDTIHYALPIRGQAIMNWISSVSIALFSIVLGWYSFGILYDTIQYNSTAPTPWATPLKYPQALWYASLLVFAGVALILAARATRLFVSGSFAQLAEEFQPKATKEELKEELEDARRR